MTTKTFYIKREDNGQFYQGDGDWTYNYEQAGRFSAKNFTMLKLAPAFKKLLEQGVDLNLVDRVVKDVE